MDAGRLAGITEPASTYEHNAKTGKTKVRLSSNFKGHLHKTTSANGEGELTIDVDSDSAAVTAAQGERASQLAELRKIEAEYAAQRDAQLLGLIAALAKPTP